MIRTSLKLLVTSLTLLSPLAAQADALTIHGQIDPSLTITAQVFFLTSDFTSDFCSDAVGFSKSGFGGRTPLSKTIDVQAQVENGQYTLVLDLTPPTGLCTWEYNGAMFEVSSVNNPSAVPQTVIVKMNGNSDAKANISEECSTSNPHYLSCNALGEGTLQLTGSDLELDISAQQ